jgi:undecaprenyl diphosphate synthase
MAHEEAHTTRKAFLEQHGIDEARVPKHVAIIMDGNGRWAKDRGEERVFGHMHGVDSVRAAVEAALKAGVRYLTLYAFSTENWNRPEEEVAALMDLLVKTLVQELEDLREKGVRLRAIGDLTSLPEAAQTELRLAEERTAHLNGLDLVLALSYSAKWELVQAIRGIIQDGMEAKDVNTETIDAYLTTAGLPDPELMVRTSGERRISNFMLWQLAYAEFHFTPVMWPDFREAHFLEAIRDFQRRERRFGGVLDTNHNEWKKQA